jgi:predicted RNase H-like nuclease (RuvC/YqgF family)
MSKMISVSTPKAETWRERMGLEPVATKPRKHKERRERIRTIGPSKVQEAPAVEVPVENRQAEVRRLKAELAKEIQRRKQLEHQLQQRPKTEGQPNEYQHKYHQAQNQINQLRANYEREKKAREAAERRVQQVTELVNQLAATVDQLRQVMKS